MARVAVVEEAGPCTRLAGAKPDPDEELAEAAPGELGTPEAEVSSRDRPSGAAATARFEAEPPLMRLAMVIPAPPPELEPFEAMEPFPEEDSLKVTPRPDEEEEELVAFAPMPVALAVLATELPVDAVAPILPARVVDVRPLPEFLELPKPEVRPAWVS